MKKGKVLALDYGTKRIGVASGDLEFKIAFPRELIENKNDEFVLKRVTELCEELGVVLVVVGLPLKMKAEQSENKLLKQVEVFVEKLRDTGLKVQLVDERLSSFEASQKVGFSHKVDQYAAQIILQRYFEEN